MTTTVVDLLPSVSKEYVNPFVQKLRDHQEFFHRVMTTFDEEDSNFRPTEGTMSVANQVLHAAVANEYFLSGIFGPYDGYAPLCKGTKGFIDMGWVGLADEKELGVVLNKDEWPIAAAAGTSIKKALALFDQVIDDAAAMFETVTPEALAAEKLPQNPVIPIDYTYPEMFELMIDHMAHHRGALVTYAHLIGKDCKIPYFELSEAMMRSEQFQALFASATGN